MGIDAWWPDSDDEYAHIAPDGSQYDPEDWHTGYGETKGAPKPRHARRGRFRQWVARLCGHSIEDTQ